jgi:hypothetical protein
MIFLSTIQAHLDNTIFATGEHADGHANADTAAEERLHIGRIAVLAYSRARSVCVKLEELQIALLGLCDVAGGVGEKILRLFLCQCTPNSPADRGVTSISALSTTARNVS